MNLMPNHMRSGISRMSWRRSTRCSLKAIFSMNKTVLEISCPSDSFESMFHFAAALLPSFSYCSQSKLMKRNSGESLSRKWRWWLLNSSNTFWTASLGISILWSEKWIHWLYTVRLCINALSFPNKVRHICYDKCFGDEDCEHKGRGYNCISGCVWVLMETRLGLLNLGIILFLEILVFLVVYISSLRSVLLEQHDICSLQIYSKGDQSDTAWMFHDVHWRIRILKCRFHLRSPKRKGMMFHFSNLLMKISKSEVNGACRCTTGCSDLPCHSDDTCNGNLEAFYNLSIRRNFILSDAIALRQPCFWL